MSDAEKKIEQALKDTAVEIGYATDILRTIRTGVVKSVSGTRAKETAATDAKAAVKEAARELAKEVEKL